MSEFRKGYIRTIGGGFAVLTCYGIYWAVTHAGGFAAWFGAIGLFMLAMWLGREPANRHRPTRSER